MSRGAEETKESKKAIKKRDKKNQPIKETSRFGFFIVVLCALLLFVSIFAVDKINHKDATKPDPLDVTAINARALSTSWTCPYLGNPTTNSLVLVNPLDTKDASIRIASYDSSGKEIFIDTLQIKSMDQAKIDLAAYAGTGDFVIFIESFSSPIGVFRNMELSDGIEVTSCIPFTSGKAVIPSLTTQRESNSLLYLANPFGEAVVVDIIGNLTDDSGEAPVSQLDEIRGLVIPARGRTTIDLQDPAAFGRFSIVSVTITSRSGFFVAEAQMSYSGAQGAQGETIVSASRELKSGYDHFVPGVNPTKIIGSNASIKAGSISLGAQALDSRSVSNEPLTFLAGSTLLMEIPGQDFGLSSLSFRLEEGSGTKNDVYASWHHVKDKSVSAGDGASLASKEKIIPIAEEDSLYLYNPSSEKVRVKIDILGSDKGYEIELDPKAYIVKSFEDLDLLDPVIAIVESTKAIFSATTNSISSRHSIGIVINK